MHERGAPVAMQRMHLIVNLRAVKTNAARSRERTAFHMSDRRTNAQKSVVIESSTVRGAPCVR